MWLLLLSSIHLFDYFFFLVFLFLFKRFSCRPCCPAGRDPHPSRFMACPSIPCGMSALLRIYRIGIRCRSSPKTGPIWSEYKRVIPLIPHREPKETKHPETKRNYSRRKRGGNPNKDDREKKKLAGLKHTDYIYINVCVCVQNTRPYRHPSQKHPHPDKWICLFVCSFVRSFQENLKKEKKKSIFYSTQSSTQIHQQFRVCVYTKRMYICMCV